MSGIVITNVTNKEKEPLDYYNNPQYHKFAIGSGTSTLVPFYKKLIEEVIGDKINETFQDYTLSKSETKAIQVIFDKKIDETLPNRETVKPYDRKLEWKGAIYDLNLSIPSPNNRRIRDYYTIVEICKECLAENKPMYLSIE